MPYVQRDKQGNVVGIYMVPQPFDTQYEEDEVSLYVDPLIALSAHRFAVENGGVVYGDKLIQTDRETRANWLGILLQAQQNPAYTVEWKTSDGSFVKYDAAGAIGAALAVSNFVQKCFVVENLVKDLIADGLSGEEIVNQFNQLME